MFSLIRSLLQEGIHLLSAFFSGNLPHILYYWCICLIALIIIQIFRENKAGIDKSSWRNRAITEFLLFFSLWTAGIVISQLLLDIIPNGIPFPQKYTYYYTGLIPLTSLYLSTIIILLLRNCSLKKDTIRIVAFLIGFVTALAQFITLDQHLLHSEQISQTYLVTISVLAGTLSLLVRLAFEVSFRESAKTM